MSNFTKEESSDKTVTLFLKGVLDAHTSFEKMVGKLPAVLILNCRQVHHMNSSAVREWMNYFSKARAAGTQFSFVECPQPIIDFININPAMLCGGKVTSASCPFFCSRCKHDVDITFNSEELSHWQDHIETKHCPSCSQLLGLDCNPDEFFRFTQDQSPGQKPL